MILLVDNYDSFTYNLFQYLCELGAQVEVLRNDVATPEKVAQLGPERLVISPGPCTPTEAGHSCALIETFGPKMPVLGVCLGHQAIGQVFGGRVVRAPKLMHGKTSMISHEGRGVFAGLPNPFVATRYHSLMIEPEGFPDCLEVLARSEDGVIQGVRHREYPVHGVQFHPESILTAEGKRLLRNFLDL